MRLTPSRLIAPFLLLLAVAGCSSLPFSGEKQVNCGGDNAYLQAVERPPLRLPPEITPTERMQPMAIPPVDPAPQKLDPVPQCLDQPPKFFARKAGAASDTRRGRGAAVGLGVGVAQAGHRAADVLAEFPGARHDHS